MLNVDSNVSSMSSHMSEQIELLIFTEQILSDLLISVTGTLRLKYQSPLRSVQRHRPRLPSPLRSLPVPSVFFYFLNISTVFTPQICDTISPKWRVMDGFPRVFQVSKHPSWRVVSNSRIFDWHVFTTSIFLYINGLLITPDLLAVMQMLIRITSNIKHIRHN